MNIALLLLLAATPASQSWRFETDGTPTVNVSNINGSIRVEATEGRTLSVEYVQEGSEAERAKTPVEVSQDGDEVSVRVRCGTSGKTFNHCSDPVNTHLVLRVPRDATLALASVQAPVKVLGVLGAQEVSSVNGEVVVTGSRGKLEVSSVSGPVVLEPEALEDMAVSTVSGNVTLRLPRDAGAQVDFSSVGGRFNGQSVSLGSTSRRYGNGGHDVDVSTVSGALDVHSDAK